MRSFSFVAAVIVVAFALAGCSSETPTPTQTPPADVIGQTLLVARPALPSGGLLILDLSTPVAGVPPTYTDGLSEGRWTVVAQCTTSQSELLGVIPSEAASPEVLRKAAADDYARMLSGCVS